MQLLLCSAEIISIEHSCCMLTWWPYIQAVYHSNRLEDCRIIILSNSMFYVCMHSLIILSLAIPQSGICNVGKSHNYIYCIPAALSIVSMVWMWLDYSMKWIHLLFTAVVDAVNDAKRWHGQHISWLNHYHDAVVRKFLRCSGFIHGQRRTI